MGGLEGQFRVFEAQKPSRTPPGVIWTKKRFLIFSRFWAVFGSHFGRFVGILGPNGPFQGVPGGPTSALGAGKPSRTSKNEFLEKVDFFRENFFRTPDDPWARVPARASLGGPGRPKVGQNRSVGLSNRLKTIGQPQKPTKSV